NSERELRDIVTESSKQTTLDDEVFSSVNAQARQDIENYIQMQHDMNQQILLKAIFDQFSNAPYGWRQLDIARIVAELLKDQRIRIRYNAVFLDPEFHVDELMNIFTKLVESAKAIITFREAIDNSLSAPYVELRETYLINVI